MSDPRKTAIVPGASQGIGAAIVKAFKRLGMFLSPTTVDVPS